MLRLLEVLNAAFIPPACEVFNGTAFHVADPILVNVLDWLDDELLIVVAPDL